MAYPSGISFTGDLSPKEMEVIVAQANIITAVRGQVIYVPGETGEVLYLLKRGSVQLYFLSADGRKLIIHTIGPMTFFGEMEMVGQQMRDMFAEAAEGCLICVMKRVEVERLILETPQVLLRMLKEMGRCMYFTQQRLSDCVFKTIRARIAKLLLNLSSNGARAIRGPRHQDLAELLGIHRETVSTTLGQLRDSGVIELRRKEISILNRQKLLALAKEETHGKGREATRTREPFSC
jgi:CRP/FNR family transcriptional regulator